MKVRIGVDKDFSLIHSGGTISANVHDITRAAQLMHGEEAEGLARYAIFQID
jgi:transposase, IS5 family